MKNKFFMAGAALLAAIILAGCAAPEEKKNGIYFKEFYGYMATEETKTFVPVVYKDGTISKTSKISVSISKDYTNGAKLSVDSVVSGNGFDLTTGPDLGKGLVLELKAEKFTKNVTVGMRIISKDAAPIGFAKIDMSKMTNEYTVSTPAELKTAINKGNCLIYVKGSIDMSEGMLPAPKSKSTDSTSALDEFVKVNSTSATYAAWIAANTNVAATADTSTSAISNAYKSKIQLILKSNTAIIGLDGAVVRGATFSIRGIENVVIRNVTIQDAVDPFPHHEKNDGWNAQHDNISIDSAKNVWIDHCTLEDTLQLGTAANGEKLQVYDGLCDMKATATNITVSYTILRNHDKTMLIGSSDTDGSADKRFITLANNYFFNCGQRCPMVRNSRIHIFNNVYDGDSSRAYSSKSTINARAGSIVCEENNYVGSAVSYSSNGGSIYSTTEVIFDKAPSYDYTLLEASKSLKDEAGAGIWPVM